MSESICGACAQFASASQDAVRGVCVRNMSVVMSDAAMNCFTPRSQGPTVADLIRYECDCLREMLLSKNAKYGNSALEPVRVFSKADPVEQIRVRLDDKLSRLMRGKGAEDEDVELDLMGYLILLRVARRMQDATA